MRHARLVPFLAMGGIVSFLSSRSSLRSTYLNGRNELLATGVSCGVLYPCPLTTISSYAGKRTTLSKTGSMRSNAATSLQHQKRSLRDLIDNILFVHVGKAGGMTVTRSSTIGCLGGAPRQRPRPPEQVQVCMNRNFPPQDGLVLPRKITKFMHMFSLNATEIADPRNAFLFVLRNPVERYISAYRYGHPSNCNEKKPKGLGNEFRCPNKQNLQNATKAKLPAVKFYKCFPSMEDLAQYSILPLPEDRNQSHCHDLARACTQGTGKRFPCGNEPHKHQYNYKFYASKTVDLHPERPVMAIRTEHEWDDLLDLDRQLGGTGKFRSEGLHYSHGSEKFAKNSLSTQGYSKICCALNGEIDIYFNLLQKAINLKPEQKQETMNELFRKCRISSPWKQWRSSCQKKLKAKG